MNDGLTSSSNERALDGGDTRGTAVMSGTRQQLTPIPVVRDDRDDRREAEVDTEYDGELEVDTEYDGELEADTEKFLFRDFSVSSLEYGYIVAIGCHKFAIETKERLAEKLSAYILNPNDSESKWWSDKTV